MPTGAILRSVKSAGGKPDGMAISWWINPALFGTIGQTPDSTSQPSFPFLGSQTVEQATSGSTNWQQYLIDPQRVQSASNFGTAKSLGLTISRYRQSFFSSTQFYINGRVIVKITGTDQIHSFAPSAPIISGTATFPTYIEDISTIIPLWSLNYSPIEIWFEPDTTSAGTSNNQASLKLVYVTLYNFDMRAPGNLG